MPVVDAPVGFQAKLRAFDPALSARLVTVKLNSKGDRGKRWAIYWTSPHSRREYKAYTVEEPRGQGDLIGDFRPLDDRVLVDLRRMDAWNRGDKKILDEMQEVNDALEHSIDKETGDLAEAMSKEYRRLFNGHPLIASGWTAPK